MSDRPFRPFRYQIQEVRRQIVSVKQYGPTAKLNKADVWRLKARQGRVWLFFSYNTFLHLMTVFFQPGRKFSFLVEWILYAHSIRRQNHGKNQDL